MDLSPVPGAAPPVPSLSENESDIRIAAAEAIVDALNNVVVMWS
jgi:hypothetical protein